jgi:hypothetical protein
MEDGTKTEHPVKVTTGSRLHAFAKTFPGRDEGLEAWILATLPDILIGWIVGSCESRAREGFFLDSLDVMIERLADKSSEMRIGLPVRDIDPLIWQDHRRSCERILPSLIAMVEGRLYHDGFVVHVTIHPNRVTFYLAWT